MKSKIIYFLIWTVTVYLGILYYSGTLLGLAALEVFLPVVSALLLWKAARKVQAKVYLSIGVTEKNQPVNGGIEIQTKSRIPLPQIQVKMKVRNLFYPQEEQIILRGMADGKSRTRLKTAISGEHCGPMLLEIQEVQVYDIFRLFSKKIAVPGKEVLAVLPEYYTADITLQENMKDFLAESEEYDKNKPGDDPLEIFQVREYRSGDRMQSIHWKLSARTDDLMVKEYSLPTGTPVVLFLDMRYQSGENYGYLDEFIESGLAVSQGLLEAGCEHYVVWFDRKRQDLERIAVKETDDRYLVTERIFSSGPYQDDVEMEELYRDKYRGETWHTQILLNLKKELWKDGELEAELSGHARDILENEIII